MDAMDQLISCKKCGGTEFERTTVDVWSALARLVKRTDGNVEDDVRNESSVFSSEYVYRCMACKLLHDDDGMALSGDLKSHVLNQLELEFRR